MQNPQNIWDKVKKIGKPAILTTILGVVITGVTTYFGIPLEFQKAQESEKPANTSSPSAVGVEGGIHINNYPSQSEIPQPVEQSAQKKKLISQNNRQEMGDGNINSPQINGKDNEVNISSERNEIGEQTNNTRNTKIGEGSQYFEDAGSDNTFCAGNDDTACSNDGTIYNNPAK